MSSTELIRPSRRVLLKPLTPIPSKRGALATAYVEIDLPFAELPTREQLVQNAASSNRYEANRARLLLRDLDKNGSLPRTYPYPVQAWQLGPDLTFIALGGEVEGVGGPHAVARLVLGQPRQAALHGLLGLHRAAALAEEQHAALEVAAVEAARPPAGEPHDGVRDRLLEPLARGIGILIGVQAYRYVQLRRAVRAEVFQVIPDLRASAVVVTHRR